MASSQHRCVFVGNIPYDVTEDQLKEICQEVGPVVHFRLVTDKETGRPKGYGFCEYIDEETALSARRNLQGYEINGRQLRVDFAENDKSSDRSRDQGRGGPGLASNPDMQKQQGVPSSHGEPSQHQPIGHQIALTAATVMAGTLSGPSNVNGVQNHFAMPNDPLTLHLAKLSRSQLNDVLSELKALAIRDKESARQLLLARPELSRALFQAEIILGLVTPQAQLQMANVRQNPAQAPKPPLTDGPSFSGLPPISQATQKLISGPLQASVVQSQAPIPQQQNTFRPVSLSNTQIRAQSSLLSSSTPNKKQTPSLQDPRKAVAASTLPSTSEPTFQAVSRTARGGPSANPPSDQYRASKLMRLEDGSKLAPVGPSPASVKPSPVTEVQYFEKQQTPQSQLPKDVESVLLQQVMTLTPEQISSLPPEQQQQVLQLQQMHRRDQH